MEKLKWIRVTKTDEWSTRLEYYVNFCHLFDWRETNKYKYISRIKFWLTNEEMFLELNQINTTVVLVGKQRRNKTCANSTTLSYSVLVLHPFLPFCHLLRPRLTLHPRKGRGIPSLLPSPSAWVLPGVNGVPRHPSTTTTKPVDRPQLCHTPSRYVAAVTVTFEWGIGGTVPSD